MSNNRNNSGDIKSSGLLDITWAVGTEAGNFNFLFSSDVSPLTVGEGGELSLPRQTWVEVFIKKYILSQTYNTWWNVQCRERKSVKSLPVGSAYNWTILADFEFKTVEFLYIFIIHTYNPIIVKHVEVHTYIEPNLKIDIEQDFF